QQPAGGDDPGELRCPEVPRRCQQHYRGTDLRYRARAPCTIWTDALGVAPTCSPFWDNGRNLVFLPATDQLKRGWLIGGADLYFQPIPGDRCRVQSRTYDHQHALGRVHGLDLFGSKTALVDGAGASPDAQRR